MCKSLLFEKFFYLWNRKTLCRAPGVIIIYSKFKSKDQKWTDLMPDSPTCGHLMCLTTMEPILPTVHSFQQP